MFAMCEANLKRSEEFVWEVNGIPSGMRDVDRGREEVVVLVNGEFHCARTAWVQEFYVWKFNFTRMKE